MTRTARASGRVVALLSLCALLAALPGATPADAQDRRDRRGDRVVIAPRAPMSVMFNRARLGVELRTRTSDADVDGAEIRRVLDGTPADDAGLRRGDIITAIDGRSLLDPLDDPDDEDRIDLDRSVPSQRLVRLVRELEPGDEVVVEYLRDGEPGSVTLDVEEGPFGFRFDWRDRDGAALAPRDFAFEMPDAAFHLDGLQDRLDALPLVWEMGDGAWSSSAMGISMMSLTPGLGRYFDAEEGVLVTDIDVDNTLGLEAGDVITAIGGRPVDSPRDVHRILRSYEEGEEVTFTIMRDRAARDVRGLVE